MRSPLFSRVLNLCVVDDQMKLAAALALSSVTDTATREKVIDSVMAFVSTADHDWRVLKLFSLALMQSITKLKLQTISPALYILGELGSTSKDEAVIKYLIPFLKHKYVQCPVPK